MKLWRWLMWQLLDRCPRCGGRGVRRLPDERYKTAATVCECCSEAWDVSSVDL